MFLYMCYLIHLRNNTDMKSYWKERTFLSSTLSTVNPTGTGLCSNPDCSSENPVSKRLSHDLAKAVISTGGLRISFVSKFLLY